MLDFRFLRLWLKIYCVVGSNIRISWYKLTDFSKVGDKCILRTEASNFP